MQYQYIMSGIFSGTDGEVYEINVPSFYMYNTKAEAMYDGRLGYRFILTSEKIGPELCVFEKEDFKVVNEDNQKHLETWVSGKCLKLYNFDEFKKAGGSIRMLKPEFKEAGYIDGNTDFIDINKTFKDIFPNMQKIKFYYIDNCAYYIKEIKEVK